MVKKKEAAKNLRITQIRSSAKRLQSHKDGLKGLGLRRMHHTVERPAIPSVLGIINQIGYMLRVEEI